MPSTRCTCGEQIQYSADKVGRIARCRCGRPVRLLAPAPEPAPRTAQEQFAEQMRAMRVRRQILAVLLFVVVTVSAVMLFSMKDTSSARQQPRQMQDDEEP